MQKPDIPFEPFPKIPRLMKDIIITEKIDGTNAGILITEELDIHASSRKRWITPEDDNFGFARWVEENAEDLVTDLGAGMHFGEWWGSKIQRTYDQEVKRLSLFNVERWGEQQPSKDPRCEETHITSRKGERVCACKDYRPLKTFTTPNLGVVPVLYQGSLHIIENTFAPTSILGALRLEGSVAAPGFMNPEGIVVYFKAAHQPFKLTFDDGPKG